MFEPTNKHQQISARIITIPSLSSSKIETNACSRQARSHRRIGKRRGERPARSIPAIDRKGKRKGTWSASRGRSGDRVRSCYARAGLLWSRGGAGAEARLRFRRSGV